MNWLRPILLLAGALFIVILVWWERRRPHQAARSVPERPERSESALAVASTAHRQEAVPSAEVVSERFEPRDRDMHRAPPVIEWPTVAPPPALIAEPEQAEVSVPAAPLPELVVDWPTEDTRRIVTLRILPSRHDRLPGRDLRQGLTACGFRHGQFGIFHLAGEDGRVVISAASLVRPGMLDPTTMDFQRFAGINVFAVFPGPASADLTLQRLSQVAVEVAARVGGRVQDENSAPFDDADTGPWRRRCLTIIEGAQDSARQTN